MPKDKTINLDSLELLLDTMCNCFGGIIFIAILLAVMVSMMPKTAKSITMEYNIEEAQKLSDKVKKLEERFSLEQESMELMQALEQRLRNDPRLEDLKKLSDAEVKMRNASDLLKIATVKKETAEKQHEMVTAESEKNEKEIIKQKTKLAKRQGELELKKQDIDFSKKELETAKTDNVMKFSYKRSTSKHPYFFILKEGKLWRIGPEPTALPNPDVLYEINITAAGKEYICKPKSNTGVKVLNNDIISDVAMEMIKEVPHGRFPFFQVYEDSTTEIFRLRELLKESKFDHAIALKLSGDSPGYIIVSHNVKFETD